MVLRTIGMTEGTKGRTDETLSGMKAVFAYSTVSLFVLRKVVNRSDADLPWRFHIGP
jgi:hypothetical protein